MSDCFYTLDFSLFLSFTFFERELLALEGLRTPLSTISQVLEAINEGMGINAACRTFKTTKKSIKRWKARLGSLKDILLLVCVMSSIFAIDNRGR